MLRICGIARRLLMTELVEGVLERIEASCVRFGRVLVENEKIVVPLLFLAGLILRIALIPDAILRQDAFVYLLKVREILAGNFIPIQAGAMGWPLVASLFFLPFLERSFAFQEYVLRVASAVVGGFVFVPLWLIARRILGKGETLAVLVLFGMSYVMVITAVSGMSESLFMLVFLFVVYCSLRIKEGMKFAYMATIFAGLCFLVRVNGLFVLGGVLLAVLLLRKEIHDFSWRRVGIMLVVFGLVLLPYLGLRAVVYGSPFDFGGESGFLLSSGQEAWSPNVEPPSLIEYVKENSFGTILNKFAFSGSVKMAYSLVVVIVGPLLILPFLVGLLYFFKKEKAILAGFLVVPGFWVLSHLPVYGTFTYPRYFYPLVPLVLMLAVAGMGVLAKNQRYKYLIWTVFVLVVIGFGLRDSTVSLNSLENDPLNKEAGWALWLADNAEGYIMVLEGQSHIMRYLPDVRFEGKGFVSGKIKTSLYPYAETFEETLDGMRRLKVDYAVIDPEYIELRPALKPLLQERNVPGFFRKVYEEDEPWTVKIYRIEWNDEE